MPPLGTPLANSKFTLNTLGVAGFFGGPEVLSTIGIMHLYEGWRWFGWYNTPGSYELAKNLGRMANSPFWDGLFPGPNEAPAVMFGLQLKRGPRYVAALSGTTTRTGHLAYLTMERRKEEKAEIIEGRETSAVDVAYLAMKPVDHSTSVKRLPFKSAPKTFLPTIVSVVTCVMCALVYDWFSFSVILFGIISTGCATSVIGGGKLVIEFAREAYSAASLAGHGVLMGEDGAVVIKGREQDVNILIKGNFNIDLDAERNTHLDEKRGVRNFDAIGACSLLLVVQFLAQLLLVPYGSLFGQIMFLASLSTSWGYNTYLSSLGVQKEKLQAKILFQTLGNPKMRRFRAGTRTTMVVFVCLLLFHGSERSSLKEDSARREKILHEYIPNNTNVWKRWKEKVVQQLLDIDEDSDALPHLTESKEEGLSESDRKLLRVLLEDARAAFKEYLRVRNELPADSSAEKVEG